MNLLVTGAAGFIGSNFVSQYMAEHDDARVVSLDLLTYAGFRENLEGVESSDRCIFVEGDITDADLVSDLLSSHNINAIVNFAAESHVDRSIVGPAAFVQTNVVGTFTLLEAARHAWKDRSDCLFLHVSTDEVYGDLGPDDPPFTEETPYRPSSPYSASKASSDHLVNAYHRTYGLPAVVTNCSNNYGPRQLPEKLIPLMILNAVSGKPLPVYGDGMQIRDWLHVTDHCKAIMRVLEAGEPGETYNIGGLCEKPNFEIVHTICDILNDLRPLGEGRSYRDLITHVKDRPGHDRRYAVDCSKIQAKLNWSPEMTLETGLRETIEWYLNNSAWLEAVTGHNYSQWLETNYAGRSEVDS